MNAIFEQLRFGTANWIWKILSLTLLLLPLASVTQAFAQTATPKANAYLGKNNAVVLGFPTCNAASFAQIPGTNNLFIARARITSTGGMAGISGPNDCSGGKQWGLTLVYLNWTTKQFTLVKPLLDTSNNNSANLSKAVLTGGPQKGAVIKSAYDPSIVLYNGQYIVSFECVLSEKAPSFGVQGTSSCISIYNPTTKTLDMSQTQVIISGQFPPTGMQYAASVPTLAVLENNLYIYWSALAIQNNQFVSIAMRDAQLNKSGSTFIVAGSGGKLVTSTQANLTTEVWAPDPIDSMSNTSVDARHVWASGNSVVALASVGGSGCVAPNGTTKGCFRMMLSKAGNPLLFHAFNLGTKSNGLAYPTNGQEYVMPIQGPDGSRWYLGHFYQTPANGYSENNPVPNLAIWKQFNRNDVLVAFPNTDNGFWPN